MRRALLSADDDAQVGSQRALGLAELEAAVATVAPANRPVLVHAEMVPPSEAQARRGADPRALL